MVKNFALLGAAGYIAPRHLKAIKETGNNLLCAMDPHDSVGILDSYFPEAEFFTEFGGFDHFFKEGKRAGGQEGRGKDLSQKVHRSEVDFVSICSPNYLHDEHILWALRSGADTICEKPLVLAPSDIDSIEQLEQETGRKVWTIQQLRLHPEILKLKTPQLTNPPVNQLTNKQTPQLTNPPVNQLTNQPVNQLTNPRKRVVLRYITPRGAWYHHSWKGDVSKSGGIAMNIGIHFFDLLIWLFGPVEISEVIKLDHLRGEGRLILKDADVEWFLSIEAGDVVTSERSGDPDASGPAKAGTSPQSEFANIIIRNPNRTLIIDGESIDLSTGFTDLHTKSYEEILAGRGFGIAEARKAIELVHSIRK